MVGWIACDCEGGEGDGVVSGAAAPQFDAENEVSATQHRSAPRSASLRRLSEGWPYSMMPRLLASRMARAHRRSTSASTTQRHRSSCTASSATECHAPGAPPSTSIEPLSCVNKTLELERAAQRAVASAGWRYRTGDCGPWRRVRRVRMRIPRSPNCLCRCRVEERRKMRRRMACSHQVSRPTCLSALTSRQRCSRSRRLRKRPIPGTLERSTAHVRSTAHDHPQPLHVSGRLGWRASQLPTQSHRQGSWRLARAERAIVASVVMIADLSRVHL